MTMSFVEILISFLLFSGAAIMLLSSIGLVRFGDVFLRMHAATKAGTLGISLIIIAVALFFSDDLTTIKLIALMGVYFFTSPIGSQVLAHSAHISQVEMVEETWIDELAEARGSQEEAPQTIKD
jgi:multicomponent Na+:H+ antiporter subunit G